MTGFDYLATGPRMGLIVPLALQSAGILESLHIDAWVPPGRRERLAERLFGPRVRNRVIRGIPPQKIRAHPEMFVLNRLAHRVETAGGDRYKVDRLLVQRLHAVARQCSSQAVFGMQLCAAELFRDRRCTVLEQFAAPGPFEHDLTQHEQRAYPGWTHRTLSKPKWSDGRNFTEWEQADIIWVPSEHLISLCERYGADATKLRVVRYPIPRFARARARNFLGDRPLRVAFAGVLKLQKGVQYIYEALRGWKPDHVDMHFFGPTQLTTEGSERLAQVGQLHGPLPRSQLFNEFVRSDVLLFPSLSEGSALVTAEAAATGLPIIATRESGPPDSAILVNARSPEGIRDALSRILDDPPYLRSVSENVLREAQRRTTDTFQAEIAALATEVLDTCSHNR